MSSRFEQADAGMIEKEKPIFTEVYNKNNWANIKDQYMLSPINGGEGKVVIKEDEFKSRFDCTTCGGVGCTPEVCPQCLGTKYHKGKEENGYCPDCTVGAGTPLQKSYGKILCETCKGQGGTIIFADDSKKNSTMGNIIAISRRNILEVKVGDKVLFTNYTGSPFTFLDVALRVCQERDLLGILKQLKKNVDGVVSGSYADLENTGVVHED